MQQSATWNPIPKCRSCEWAHGGGIGSQGPVLVILHRLNVSAVVQQQPDDFGVPVPAAKVLSKWRVSHSAERTMVSE